MNLQRLMFLWEYVYFFTRESGVTSCTRTRIVTLCCFRMRVNEDTVGELRMTTSTLQEGDVTRERTTGQGARLLRGEEQVSDFRKRRKRMM